MRRILSYSVAVIIGLALLAAPAGAWEFKMSGAWYGEYESFGQGGDAGFFGPHDGGPAGLEQINFWTGHQGGDWTVSGHDAAWWTQYASFDMEVKINKALKIQGNYYVGAWDLNNSAGVLVASEYPAKQLNGVQQSFSPGYWNWMRISAKLPWGDLSFGKRPSRFGCGLFWNGDENTSSESISLGVPYGPLKIGFSFYPARNGETYYSNNPGGNNTWFDKSANRTWNFAHALHYINGPMMTGYQMAFVGRHRGPERAIGGAAGTRDRWDFYGGIYVKYNNGRFFFNAEGDWFDRTIRHYGQAPDYHEHRGYMVEGGTFIGPMKISLLHARITGLDPKADTTGLDASNDLSNTGVFQPYSYVAVYNYGLGDPANPQTGNGEVRGASVFAARLDYAVAANLNVFMTGFKAIRLEKAYGRGYIQSNGDGTVGFQAGTTALSSGAYTYDANGAPNARIPDDDLGWEIDAGMSWKLLEGFMLDTTFGYWQPGDWFKFACTDKAGVPFSPVAGANIVIEDRAIDPVWGLNVLVSAEF